MYKVGLSVHFMLCWILVGLNNNLCLEGAVSASNYFIILVHFEIYAPCKKSFVVHQVSMSVC